jgi:hypothetical protein
MATYTTLPDATGPGFHVVVLGTNRSPETVVGFATEAEAAGWIASDRHANIPWSQTRWGAAD